MAEAFARALERDAPLAAVALGRALHAAGVPVTPDRSARFAAAAAISRPRDRAALYWTARVALVSAQEHLPVFDAVFSAVVDGLVDPADGRGASPARAPSPTGTDPPPPRGLPATDPGPFPGGAAPARPARPPGGGRAGEHPVASLASPAEQLAGTSFGDLDAEEMALLARLIRRLSVATPPRRARRARVAARGERLDVRATLRRSLRTAGDPVRQARRRRVLRPRPLVALLDVSGSMEPYARAHGLLLEGAARGAAAEAFVFATRLTRITRALREGRAEAALERAARAAPDWSGGTRIGEALGAFLDGWGRRGMARGAIVLIVSDGWERGDPALVGQQMERLARLAHRVVWVNPRASAPGFRPLAGGMAAALPHVDELVGGHSLAAFDSVVEAIGRHR